MQAQETFMDEQSHFSVTEGIEGRRPTSWGRPNTEQCPVIEFPSQRRRWWGHVDRFSQVKRSHVITGETHCGCAPSQETSESASFWRLRCTETASHIAWMC